jgi:hypothetical protein
MDFLNKTAAIHKITISRSVQNLQNTTKPLFYSNLIAHGLFFGYSLTNEKHQRLFIS